MVPSSSADITHALRESFREESVYMYVVSFQSKVNLQRCGDVFFNNLITSMRASALGMF